MKSPGPGVLLVNSIELLRKKWYQFSTVFLKMFSSWGSTSQLVFSSVRFTRSVVSDSLRSHESQHARPPCLPPTPGVHSDSRPSSQWCHPAISSSVIPFSCLPSFPASGLFKWVSSLCQVAKVLEFQLQHQSFQWTPRTDLLQSGIVGSPCSPRDS